MNRTSMRITRAHRACPNVMQKQWKSRTFTLSPSSTGIPLNASVEKSQELNSSCRKNMKILNTLDLVREPSSEMYMFSKIEGCRASDSPYANHLSEQEVFNLIWRCVEEGSCVAVVNFLIVFYFSVYTSYTLCEKISAQRS